MGARRNLFWKVVLILYLFYPVVRVIISIFVTSFNHSDYNPIDIIIKHIFVTTGNVPQWSTLSFPTWCARKQCQILRLKSKISLIRGKEPDTKNSPEKKMFVWWKVDDPYWIPRKVLLATWRHQSVLWNHFHTRVHNADKSQEWASRLLITTDTTGLQTTGLLQVTRNIYIIIITH